MLFRANHQLRVRRPGIAAAAAAAVAVAVVVAGEDAAADDDAVEHVDDAVRPCARFSCCLSFALTLLLRYPHCPDPSREQRGRVRFRSAFPVTSPSPSPRTRSVPHSQGLFDSNLRW